MLIPAPLKLRKDDDIYHLEFKNTNREIF